MKCPVPNHEYYIVICGVQWIGIRNALDMLLDVLDFTFWDEGLVKEYAREFSIHAKMQNNKIVHVRK